MSKAASGHFSGTTGTKIANKNMMKNAPSTDIIGNRVNGLDLREHPVKQYSKTSLKKIREKVSSKTATREEYKKLSQATRLNARRKEGVRQFWEQERIRIINNLPTTRNWTDEQKKAICAGLKPQHKGRTIQGHHTYSVSKYPHLSNNGAVIFPATYYEHLYGWHGGNYSTSKPGVPIKLIKEF